MFDSLWVGDTVVFQALYYNEWEEDGSFLKDALTVVNGSGVKITSAYVGMGDHFGGVTFTTPGRAAVRVSVTDPATGAPAEKTFSFTVSERPADKPVTVSHDFPTAVRLKLGDSANIFAGRKVWMDNLNYGTEPISADGSSGGLDVSGNAGFVEIGGMGGFSWDFVGDERSCPIGGIDLLQFREYRYANRPGDLVIQPPMF